MGVRKHGTIRNRYLATSSVLALRNDAGIKLHKTALLYIITQLCENWASLWICILFYAILTGNGGSIGILF